MVLAACTLVLLAIVGAKTKPAQAVVPGIDMPAGFDSEVFYSGDQLSYPSQLFFDPSGNLLVADWGTTFGCGTQDGKLVSITPTGSASVLASGNGLVEPDGMAFSPGGPWDSSLYIADHNGSCGAGQLFKYGSGSLSPFSTPAAPWGFSDPISLAFGPGGEFGTDLYVADCTRGATCQSGSIGGGIWRVDPAGNKTALHRGAPLAAPIDLEFGPGGAFGHDLYVADFSDEGIGTTGYIYKLDSSGVPTLFAGGPGSAFADPSDIAFAPGGVFGSDLYVRDRTTGDIYRVDSNGQVSAFASGFTTDRFPGGMAFGPGGKDLYAINGNSIIRIFPTDTTEPTLDLPGGSSGGITEEATSTNGATVNYTATATDDVDGDVSVTCDPASDSTFAIGITTVNCSATDAADNTAAGSFTVTVKDTTAPTISGVPSDITETATGSSGASVTYTAPTATDAVDGDVNVTCEPPSGSTFPLGETTVTCSATDQAGNEASESFKVKILYDFDGFFSPVNNLPTLNSVNAGRAIPIKFDLSGDQGLDIFAAGYPKSQQVACSSTAPVDGIEETVTAGGSSLHYDSGADRYNYVWKTDKAWAGTCRQFVLKLKDGSSQRANFKFK